jgi:hypothetical protein
MTNAEYRKVLMRFGITPPSKGTISDARWVASRDDWYIRIRAQWFWWDARSSEWKATREP